MPIFSGAKKCDLKILADVLGEKTNDSHNLKDLQEMILSSKDYHEECAKEWLNTIIQERKETEIKRLRQQEIEPMKEEIQAEERVRKDEVEFEIPRLRLEAEEDPVQVGEKLKDTESELVTTGEENAGRSKRKRTPCKRFSFSGDEASSDDDISSTSKDFGQLNEPKLSENLASSVHQNNSLVAQLKEDLLKIGGKSKEAESEIVTAEMKKGQRRGGRPRKRINLSSNKASCDDVISPTSKDISQLKVPNISEYPTPVHPKNSLGAGLRGKVLRDLLKVVKKLKQAESESVTADVKKGKRRRGKVRPDKRINLNSNKASCDDHISPSSKEVGQLEVPKLSENPTPSVHQSSSLGAQLMEEPSEETSQLRAHPDPIHPVSRTSFSSLASPQKSDALNNIASTLVSIERRLLEIERTQNELLKKLNSNHTTTLAELPHEVNLPCNSIEEVNNLEKWLINEDNVKALVASLCILGGKNITSSVRRILEKLFTNDIAACYNFTGKYNKKALKDLTITKIIPGIVRKNKTSVNATDAEIHEVMSNWFRYSKDRDGGRYRRLQNCNNM